MPAPSPPNYHSGVSLQATREGGSLLLVLLYPLPRGFRNTAGVGGNTRGDSLKA